MNYTCIDPVEYLYPDITSYTSGTDRIQILTPRGSYACAQIMLWGIEDSVEIICQGWDPEIYEMLDIPVSSNEKITDENRTPQSPIREAPFRVYDCLKPCEGKITMQNGVVAVWFSQYIPRDAEPGTMEASIRVATTEIPVTLEISPVTVPEETLKILMFTNKKQISVQHSLLPDTPEYEEMYKKYLRLLRRMHQNLLYVSQPKAEMQDNQEYNFDFSEMEAEMYLASSLGYKGFYTDLGARKSWEESTIYVNQCTIASMSREGLCFLAQYLPRLQSFLEEHGWLDGFLLCIQDEPNRVSSTEFRALCGIVRRYAPRIRLTAPISHGVADGVLDVAIPQSNEYLSNRDDFEFCRRFGDELWYYDCCFPRGGGYINRFMDEPLIHVRYHGWANYFYDMKGYLHWAANQYQPGQNPFLESCPMHTNADASHRLEAGDTHIMYPGTDGPWMSVRMENHRASAEEYELLRLLERQDKEEADRICDSVFHAFNHVEYDPVVFRSARNALIRALEGRVSERM